MVNRCFMLALSFTTCTLSAGQPEFRRALRAHREKKERRTSTFFSPERGTDIFADNFMEQSSVRECRENLIAADRDGNNELSTREYAEFIERQSDGRISGGFTHLDISLVMSFYTTACSVCYDKTSDEKCCVGPRAHIPLLPDDDLQFMIILDFICPTVDDTIADILPPTPPPSPVSPPAPRPTDAPATETPVVVVPPFEVFFPTPTPVTNTPTRSPTTPADFPTIRPTDFPTPNPTRIPTTAPPSDSPTDFVIVVVPPPPTPPPILPPMINPTSSPTRTPVTTPPTAFPTFDPTARPTPSPTAAPISFSPTGAPISLSPTATPTRAPTTLAPVTDLPTQAPTAVPTSIPQTCVNFAYTLQIEGGFSAADILDGVGNTVIERLVLATRTVTMGIVDNAITVVSIDNVADSPITCETCVVVASTVCVELLDGQDEDALQTLLLDGLAVAVDGGSFTDAVPPSV